MGHGSQTLGQGRATANGRSRELCMPSNISPPTRRIDNTPSGYAATIDARTHTVTGAFQQYPDGRRVPSPAVAKWFKDNFQGAARNQMPVQWIDLLGKRHSGNVFQYKQAQASYDSAQRYNKMNNTPIAGTRF